MNFVQVVGRPVDTACANLLNAAYHRVMTPLLQTRALLDVQFRVRDPVDPRVWTTAGSVNYYAIELYKQDLAEL